MREKEPVTAWFGRDERAPAQDQCELNHFSDL